VDSDWSFFVLPGNFNEVKVQTERLLEIITDIYRDDEIRNVTQQADAFYCFPLDSYLICMRLWRPNFNDISGRPIWTFAGIVVDLSQMLSLKAALPDLISNSYVFDKIEADYMNYRGAVPFPPEKSSGRTLSVTDCEQHKGLSDEEKQSIERKKTKSLSPKIVSFPFNSAGRQELIKTLKLQVEECGKPPVFFVFGPGIQAFTQENMGFSQSRPVNARLKASFLPSREDRRDIEERKEKKELDPHKLIEYKNPSSPEQENLPSQEKITVSSKELQVEREETTQVKWDYCRIHKTQMNILGFRISLGPQYIAEKTDRYGRKDRVAEDDDQLQLGLKLEGDGWTPYENSNWRETGEFPSKWKKVYSLTPKT